MEVTVKLDKEDLAAMHDVIFDVTGGKPSESQIKAYWDKIPDDVKNNAVLFGCNDTVFRDGFYTWLESNMEPLKLHYVLLKSPNVMVKEGEFFKEQGGLKEKWGKNWVPVKAKSIEHARAIGTEIRDSE